MACNNKDFHNGCELPYCKITNGECQFITHDEICPMRFWKIENEVKYNTNKKY